jgi:hypothetical protein
MLSIIAGMLLNSLTASARIACDPVRHHIARRGGSEASIDSVV